MPGSDPQASAGTLAQVRRGYANTTAGQVHYRRAAPIEANAAPLVCLHMSPASGFVFESLLGRLGTDREAVAPDTPGFGASDPLPAYPEIADYARVLLDVVDDLGLDAPVDLLGYHTGSSIACEMALQQPAMVGRIVMISAPVFTAADLAALRPLGPAYAAVSCIKTRKRLRAGDLVQQVKIDIQQRLTIAANRCSVRIPKFIVKSPCRGQCIQSLMYTN